MNKLYSLQTSTSSVLFGHRPRGYHQILEAVRYVPLVLWHPSWPPCWWNMTSFRRHFCGSEREDIWWQDLQSHKPLHPFDSTMQLPIPVEPSFKTKRNNLEFHGGLGLEFCTWREKQMVKTAWRIGGFKLDQFLSKEDPSSFHCQMPMLPAGVSAFFGCSAALNDFLLRTLWCRQEPLKELSESYLGVHAKSCRNAKARIVANHYSYYTFCHSTCCVFNSWVCVFGLYSPCFLRIVGCWRLISLSNLAKHACRSSQNVHEVDVWSTGKTQG